MSTTAIRATTQIDFDGDITIGHKLTNVTDPTSAQDAATKNYVDGLLDAVNGLQYKGVIDSSTNPNYPAASSGWTYKISVGGKIGGASGTSVAAGDLIICTNDSTASGDQATVGAYWDVVHVAGASGTVTSIESSSVDREIVLMSGTSGQTIQKSLVTIDSSGSVNIPAGQTYKINGTALAAGDVGLGNVSNNAQLILAKYIVREAPSGTKNGSNAAFTLANTPVSGTEMLFLNGVLQNAGAGNDYTISTNTITMLTGAIPVSTDVLLCTYVSS